MIYILIAISTVLFIFIVSGLIVACCGKHPAPLKASQRRYEDGDLINMSDRSDNATGCLASYADHGEGSAGSFFGGDGDAGGAGAGDGW